MQGSEKGIQLCCIHTVRWFYTPTAIHTQRSERETTIGANWFTRLLWIRKKQGSFRIPLKGLLNRPSNEVRGKNFSYPSLFSFKVKYNHCREIFLLHSLMSCTHLYEPVGAPVEVGVGGRMGIATIQQLERERERERERREWERERERES